MATEDDHLRKARANEAFARLLSPADRPDRKIIVSFYSALHYVEAIIVRSGHRSSDHAARANYLRVLPVLEPIRSEYLALANWAWKARYDPTMQFSKTAEVQSACDLAENVRRRLIGS